MSCDFFFLLLIRLFPLKTLITLYALGSSSIQHGLRFNISSRAMRLAFQDFRRRISYVSRAACPHPLPLWLYPQQCAWASSSLFDFHFSGTAMKSTTRQCTR